jgi:hypothetical protein
VPARGTFMGNRGGVIHNEERRIVRQYADRRWIACVLEFKGRKRVVMSPRRYTELFFLDEAVALAAGHRPCAECRRARFNAFREAWGGGRVLADEMDRQIHPARIDARKSKVTYRDRVDLLPNGCFVEMDGAAFLAWNDRLLRWTADGYVDRLEKSSEVEAVVLTPRPIVECLRRGYVPEVHWSVGEAAPPPAEAPRA